MLMGISDLAPGSLLWMPRAAEAIDKADHTLELDPSDIQAIEITAMVILSVSVAKLTLYRRGCGRGRECFIVGEAGATAAAQNAAPAKAQTQWESVSHRVRTWERQVCSSHRGRPMVWFSTQCHLLSRNRARLPLPSPVSG